MGPGVRLVPEDLPITVDRTRQDLCEETPEIPHAHRPWPVAMQKLVEVLSVQPRRIRSRRRDSWQQDNDKSRAADGMPRFQLIVPRIGLFL